MTHDEMIAELDAQIFGLELLAERSALINAHFIPRYQELLFSKDRTENDTMTLWTLRQYTIDEQHAITGHKRDIAALVAIRLQLSEDTLRINDLYAQVNRLQSQVQTGAPT